MKDINLNDEDLILGYLHSEPTRCFEILYFRYSSKVFKRCFSLMGGNTEQAQDFTHDIFVIVFNKLSEFQHRSLFSTWLYSISYNYCMTQLRLAKRLQLTPLHSVDRPFVVDMPFEGSTDDQLSLVHRALALLSPTDQRLMTLRYEAGMSIEQIRQLYGLKASAVKMRLNRTHKKVKVTCEQLANL